VLTLAIALTIAVFVLSPAEWALSQSTRFTQMTTLIGLIVTTMPLAGYFARRYDRQRERIRVARTRREEIIDRLNRLDGLMGNAVRRRRRRASRRWVWRLAHVEPFARPSLESMDIVALEDAAATLGETLAEERVLRAAAYTHAGIVALLTLVLAFGLTLLGPQYLGNFLGGPQVGGAMGPDPLVFWLALTIILMFVGGLGTHRVSRLLRRARDHRDRLLAIERALWDARVLLRERRQEL
jgi:hypothetical protein